MSGFCFADCDDKANIVICCGSGGVGKTTISSAIGLRGALSGRRTIILTIDPARRLADALGLESFRTDIQPVPLNGLKPESGAETAAARLDVQMLDAKNTFDGLIQRYAPDDLAEKIFLNRYYQYLSGNMAGSHEYMAMEKLYDIYYQGRYDLIVLDTPPSRRALDFLDAPERMLNLLGHEFFRKWFKPYLSAGRWGVRFLNIFASPFLLMMAKLIGKQALTDFAGFLQLWDDVLFEGFSRRAAAVRDLLAAEHTCFLAVTTPQRLPLNEAVYFFQRIMENKMHFGGFIVNRVHDWENVSRHAYRTEEISAVCGKMFPPELLPRVAEGYENFRTLAQNDMNALKWLRKTVGSESKIVRLLFHETGIAGIDDLYVLSRRLGDER